MLALMALALKMCITCEQASNLTVCRLKHTRRSSLNMLSKGRYGPFAEYGHMVQKHLSG